MGTANTALGAAALAANLTGAGNTAFGFEALKLDTASSNTAFGSQALNKVVAGANNTAVGFNALAANTAGNNSALGYEALKANTTGTNNTAVGYRALAATATQLNDIVVVGHQATAGGDNAVAIGSGAAAGAAGSVAIGKDSAGTSASTSTVDAIKLGTALHTVYVTGKLNVGGAITTGSGSAGISSSSGDVVLSDFSANTVFRGTRFPAWADSKNSQFFQIGNTTDYCVFSAKNGSILTRAALTSTVTQIANSAYNLIPAPVAGNVLEVLNASNIRLSVDTIGTVTAGKDLKTAAPAGGASAAGAWQLGTVVTAAATVDATRYVEVSIGGVIVKLACVA